MQITTEWLGTLCDTWEPCGEGAACFFFNKVNDQIRLVVVTQDLHMTLERGRYVNQPPMESIQIDTTNIKTQDDFLELCRLLNVGRDAKRESYK